MVLLAVALLLTIMVVGFNIPTSPLGERVPKITKTTGNISFDLERKHEREAFITVINGLHHNPSVRVRVKDFMLDLLEEQERRNGFDQSDVPVSTLGAIEEVDRVALLVSHSKLSAHWLGQVKQNDPKSINYLCMLALNSSLSLILHTNMSSRRVLTLAWGLRVEEAGRRLEKVTDKDLCCDGDGYIVNWAKVGVYACKWGEAGLESIVHKATGHTVVPDKDLHITAEFEILYNWADMSAMLQKGAAKFKICDMFGRDLGPHKVRLASGKLGTQAWARHAARAQMIHEREQKEQKAKLFQVDASSYYTPQKERKLESTKRAREVLLAREAATDKRRRFNIKTAC